MSVGIQNMKSDMEKEIFSMWNSEKSVGLSVVCTRVVMVLIVACAIALPWLIRIYEVYTPYEQAKTYATILMMILYCSSIPAFIAMLCLDRLLSNIKSNNIFTGSSVKQLRRISWCCFVVAVLMAVAVRFYLLFVVPAIAAAFIGLILRVVKNVIEEAIIIKSENELTI